MKRFALVVLVLAAVVCVAGCAKKADPLEDMQQPMSPEDLNRLSTQSAPAQSAAAPAAMTPVASVLESAEDDLEALPPGGPYQPLATEIQTALKNAGLYLGAIDGKIGPMTKAAIEAFQKANGLVVDGKVGSKTWQLLSKYLNQALPAGTLTD